ncbi:MAG: hypothetical protein IPM82_31130, partial [Saprospiraceae bacterium]|nr:hypothetical protein [Saprospiraceae bacterium]
MLIPAGTVHRSARTAWCSKLSATLYFYFQALGLGSSWHGRGCHAPSTSGTASRTSNGRVNDRPGGQNLAQLGGENSRRRWLAEERTGLHETESPIETRRHWFTKTVYHDTGGNLNVLNLVEGRKPSSKARRACSSFFGGALCRNAQRACPGGLANTPSGLWQKRGVGMRDAEG